MDMRHCDIDTVLAPYLHFIGCFIISVAYTIIGEPCFMSWLHLRDINQPMGGKLTMIHRLLVERKQRQRHRHRGAAAAGSRHQGGRCCRLIEERGILC